MSDVPKIVRQRAAQQPPGEHLDANLLAAFAEGGLTRAERAQVLAHLGTCAACREVMALALPESAAVMLAATQTAKSWLRWPMLRWAAAAAAVVVVAAAVMLVKPRQQVPAPMKQTEVAVSPDKTATKPAETATAIPVSPPLMDQVRRKDSAPAVAAKQEPKSKALKKEDVSAGHGGKDALGTQALEHAPASRGLDRLAKANEALRPQAPAESASVQQPSAQSAKAQPQLPAAVPPPAPTPGVAGGIVGGMATPSRPTVAPSQPAMTAENAQLEVRSQVAAGKRGKRPLPPGSHETESVEVMSSAPAVAADSAVRAPMARVAPKAIVPRWRVSAEGELERSVDGGVSWETVRVASTPVAFRSVFTANHDIWTGGTGGALYHSADDGRTWTRVAVKALDMVLATDIVRVEFTDNLHGTVTTIDGVRWITNDAGVTWSLVASPPGR